MDTTTKNYVKSSVVKMELITIEPKLMKKCFITVNPEKDGATKFS